MGGWRSKGEEAEETRDGKGEMKNTGLVLARDFVAVGSVFAWNCSVAGTGSRMAKKKLGRDRNGSEGRVINCEGARGGQKKGTKSLLQGKEGARGEAREKMSLYFFKKEGQRKS